MDEGDDHQAAPALAGLFGFIGHIRSRGEEAEADREAGKRARQWVVEPAHSWLNRFRRLLIQWVKEAENYLAMLHTACAFIVFQQVVSG